MSVDAAYPFACNIYFRVDAGEFDTEYDSYRFICSDPYAESSVEFENDVWEHIVMRDDIKDLADGTYFVYVSGKMVFEYSHSLESGSELDSVYPDVEYINIHKFPPKHSSESLTSL